MKWLILQIVIGFLLNGCSNPIKNDSNKYDERILGKWGNILSPINQKYPSPKNYFNGYSFTKNEMNRLGIEHNTGRIREISELNYSNLTYLGNNQFEVDLIMHQRRLHKYSFSNDSLILDDGWQIKIFKKIKSDSIYFERQNSEMKFTYKNNIHKNLDISAYLSAYSTKINENILMIKGKTDNVSLTLEIEKFKGIGVYRAPNFKVELWEGSTDLFTGYMYDSVAIGEIRIIKYDEIKNICNGYFSFTNYRYSESEIPTYFDVRNGEFKVPIYK